MKLRTTPTGLYAGMSRTTRWGCGQQLIRIGPVRGSRMSSHIDEQRCRGIDVAEIRDGSVIRVLRKLGQRRQR